MAKWEFGFQITCLWNVNVLEFTEKLKKKKKDTKSVDPGL